MDTEYWKCPICQELLYKPVASPCEHLFCTWCIHKAMSPYTKSQCPLCRTKFGHFPGVVVKLHYFLQSAFPKEYAEREAETLEEERYMNVSSQQFESRHTPQPWHLSAADFLCDHCNQLLYKPTILNCGHVVCSTICHSSSTSPCPVCKQPSFRQASICTQLEGFLAQYLPAEYQQRQQEVESSLIINSHAENETEAALNEPPKQPCIPSTTVPPDQEAPQAQPDQQQPDQQQQQHESYNTMLQNIINKGYSHFGIGCDVCGAYPIIGSRYKCLDCPESIGFDLCNDCYVRTMKSDDADDDLGQSHETMTASATALTVGRFNQRHTRNHKMELVRPRLTSLHVLQEANPELGFDQLMSLIEMSWSRREIDHEIQRQERDREGERGEDEGEENRVNDGLDVPIDATTTSAQGPPPSSTATTARITDTGEEYTIMLRPRGPRPARPVQGAVWPSPSAPSEDNSVHDDSAARDATAAE